MERSGVVDDFVCDDEKWSAGGVEFHSDDGFHCLAHGDLVLAMESGEYFGVSSDVLFFFSHSFFEFAAEVVCDFVGDEIGGIFGLVWDDPHGSRFYKIRESSQLREGSKCGFGLTLAVVVDDDVFQFVG